MCGIVAAASKTNVTDILMAGLKHLEYRGYDSAGIAILKNNVLNNYRQKGNVEELGKLLDATANSNIGIAHTRWATHGPKTDINSHPHMSIDKIFSVVHNAIIENNADIKKK